MQYKNYLISLNPVTNTFEVFGTNYVFFDPLDIEKLANNIPEEVISAAIYQLLESLKDHTPEGHEKATAE